MGDVFKTQEVLQRIPGISSSKNPMRVVRGIYVSGPYLPPYYSNNAIMIVGISSHKPSIVDYTERTELTTIENSKINHHGTFALCDMDINTNFDVTYYSQQTKSTALDDTRTSHGTFALCDIDVSVNYDILSYTSEQDLSYLDKTQHGTFALCDMDINTKFICENYYIIHGDRQCDDCIMICDILINKATITNIT